jgi:ADP-heptose:LPS heptosyltransferase
MDIYVKDVPTLIGDFLGCLPALQELAKNNNVYIEEISDYKSLYSLIPKDQSIHPTNLQGKPITYTISINNAFNNAHINNWYMSQAFFKELNLYVPSTAPKAILSYDESPQNDFYFISPFARSLPPQQKWSQENWQSFVNINKDKNFRVLGNTRFDEPNFIIGDNVSDFYDRDLRTVAGVLKSSNGLISVVTGTSHLAFHLSVKNIVLNNQDMTWGRNPDAIHITTHIEQLKPITLSEYL